jgi:Holliday junction DNA helicase RuvA
MIGRLSGTLLEKNPPSLLIDVGGVGYEVEVPMSTYYELPGQGQSVQLLTHFVVREDAQLLYGFASVTERATFRALLKVNGVGAKVALSILSGLSTDEFFAYVAKKDITALTKVPGIGKKTAERLVVELQDKVESFNVALPADDQAPDVTTVRAQAEDALLALGYKATEAKRLVEKNAVDGHSVEEIIRAALRSIRLKP